jgi:MFS family permease
MAKSDEPVSRKSAGMISISANKRAPSARGIFSPLRHAVFRRIWTASLLSNLGILVLGVGAAWTMTQISSSTGMVALVQTSLMLPVALVSTPAGAIADMFDRRIVGIVALSIALTGSISLSALAWLGVVTPVLLLVFCFIIGSGMALFGPAWQASVSEQVPAEALPSAVALNGATTLPAASGLQSGASLSRRRGRSLHSPRMRFSICPFSVSCFSGAG